MKTLFCLLFLVGQPLLVFGLSIGCQKTTKGDCCIFPYYFKGQKYTSCYVNSAGDNWCATKLNEDGTIEDYGWGYCAGCKLVSNGKCCKFPFVDNNGVRREFPVSLNKDCKQSYCATEVDKQLHIVEWDFLKSPVASKNCTMKTIRGECCVFPFKSTTNSASLYQSCDNIYEEDAVTYCATSVNQNQVKLSQDYCADCQAKTKSGNCCIFPFKFNGKRYDSCGSTATKYCATRVDNCMNLVEWEHCECQKTKSGKCCVFPFFYKAKKYSQCTDQDTGGNGKWCATKVGWSSQYYQTYYMTEWDYCAV